MWSARPTATSATGARFARGPTRSPRLSNPPPPPTHHGMLRVSRGTLQPTLPDPRVELHSRGTTMSAYTSIKRHSMVLQTLGTVAIFAALWGLFLAVLHPWLMNWGSTRDEQAMV